MAGKSLFKVSISTGGKFECFQPAEEVYLLAFESPPDNRLTPEFCEAFVLALDIVEQKLPPGVLITTSSITKFYSNGLDLEKALANPGFFPNCLYPLFHRLMTFSMPTVALLNGHAFAGGFLLASQHDYRIMNPNRGYICMNEVDFGAVIESSLLAAIRAKFSTAPPHVFRSLILEGQRFTATASLEAGLIDATGGLDEALKLIAEKQLTKKVKAGVFGKLREVMWKDAVREVQIGGHEAGVSWREGVDTANRIRRHIGEANVAEWEKKGGAKL